MKLLLINHFEVLPEINPSLIRFLNRLGKETPEATLEMNRHGKNFKMVLTFSGKTFTAVENTFPKTLKLLLKFAGL